MRNSINKYRLFLFAFCLIFSVGLNIYQFTKKRLPVINFSGDPFIQTVGWDQTSKELRFAGVFEFNDKKLNPKDYFYISVKVGRKMTYPFNVECITNEAAAYDGGVVVSTQTNCEILSIDFQGMTASIRHRNVDYVVTGNSVSWSDSRNDGYLGNVLKRIR